MRSPSHRVERAQPHLGTTIRIWVEGLDEERGHRLISQAFQRVAEVHRLMSFHSPESELNRLHRLAWWTCVPVHDYTRRVLARALHVAALSEGVFDPTLAPALVSSGLLPRPDAIEVDPAATWKDIELSADGSVTFKKPLWIDLGGIAKGFAVDCAMDLIRAAGPSAACVDAGGDLSLIGAESAEVHLVTPSAGDLCPVLRVRDACIASSGSQHHHGDEHGLVCPHVDTRAKAFCGTNRFVTVVAPRCIDADALTKVVMAVGPAAAPVLAHFQAEAFLCEGSTWIRIPDDDPIHPH